ncbi:hypothetical protein, partial [Kingella pumchi]
SFPRRRESCQDSSNVLFYNILSNIKQGSRLRGNDGIACFSGCLVIVYRRCHVAAKPKAV